METILLFSTWNVTIELIQTKAWIQKNVTVYGATSLYIIHPYTKKKCNFCFVIIEDWNPSSCIFFILIYINFLMCTKNIITWTVGVTV